MAEENQWKRSIEEVLQGLNESVQNLQVQQQLPPPTVDDGRPVTDMKKQPQHFNKGEDPTTYLMHFEAVGHFNRWGDAQRARAFPTYLHASALQWYTNLDRDTKENFDVLKAAFIRRYQGANDRHKLEQEFAHMRFNRYTDLEEYADRLEDLGARIGKTSAEVVQKFVVGLPDAIYRWVSNSVVTDLGDALELAHQGLVLFPLRTGKYPPREDTAPARRERWSPQPKPEYTPRREFVPRQDSRYGEESRSRPREERNEEPMEFRQRYHGRRGPANSPGQRGGGPPPPSDRQRQSHRPSFYQPKN